MSSEKSKSQAESPSEDKRTQDTVKSASPAVDSERKPVKKRSSKKRKSSKKSSKDEGSTLEERKGKKNRLALMEAIDVKTARENPNQAIVVRNMWKKYHGPFGGDWVLKDTNFTIPHGVSVGLIGKNGAGKSTLLKLLGGMDAPDKGEIKKNCRVSWPIGLKGGFQGSMSGRQNVKFVARIMGAGNNIDEIVEKVRDFAEIGKAFDQPITTYSSGMKSRIGFGLSLAFDFDVYLSDEATSVGDISFKEKAKKAFRERVGKSSIIMVSHSLGILRDMCQAGIWLHNGQAIWFDDLEDAIEQYYKSIGK